MKVLFSFRKQAVLDRDTNRRDTNRSSLGFLASWGSLDIYGDSWGSDVGIPEGEIL